MRVVMAVVCALIAVSLGFTGLTARGQGTAVPRPNILIIQADDLGYGDLSAYGQTQFRTPSLDRLAAEGTRFTQYYSGSTVCAPSRATLMTGLHTGHAWIRGNGEVPASRGGRRRWRRPCATPGIARRRSGSGDWDRKRRPAGPIAKGSSTALDFSITGRRIASSPTTCFATARACRSIWSGLRGRPVHAGND